MAELMVDFILSLDGYAAADGWHGSRASRDGVPGVTATSPRNASTDASGREHPPADVRLRDNRRRPRTHPADRAAEGGVLLRPDRAAGVGEHPSGPPGPGPCRPVDGTGRPHVPTVLGGSAPLVARRVTGATREERPQARVAAGQPQHLLRTVAGEQPECHLVPALGQHSPGAARGLPAAHDLDRVVRCLGSHPASVPRASVMSVSC